MINKYYTLSEDQSVLGYVTIPTEWLVMFILTYFIRRTLTQFFVAQSQAEKTQEALTQILDNLPDAVLML
jgi:hypothetical protein